MKSKKSQKMLIVNLMNCQKLFCSRAETFQVKKSFFEEEWKALSKLYSYAPHHTWLQGDRKHKVDKERSGDHMPWAVAMV